MPISHTPGPWAAKVADTINDEPAYWRIEDRHRGVVGDVQSVNPADAALIAAAPDLLAALELAIECMYKAFDYVPAGHENAACRGNLVPTLQNARAAIAKAITDQP